MHKRAQGAGPDKQNDGVKSKQAILLMYDENLAVDELRKKCSSKPIWNNLPHKDLHNKLDMLERSFLSSKSLRDSAKKENLQKSEALSLLEIKMTKHLSLRGQLANKVWDFMEKYTRLHEGNVEKGEEINRLRKQLNAKKKGNEQMGKLVENENKRLLRARADLRARLQFQARSNERYKLLYSD